MIQITDHGPIASFTRENKVQIFTFDFPTGG